MKSNKVKKNTFVCLHDFMVTEYELKGNELFVYAIIYGFSQDGESCFCGGLKYLQDWTKSSKQGILDVLKKLLDKKLIIKYEVFEGNRKFCKYKVTRSKENEEENKGQESLSTMVNKVDGVGQESLPQGSNKLTDKGQESLPNNIYNNIDIENLNNISDEKEKTPNGVKATALKKNPEKSDITKLKESYYQTYLNMMKREPCTKEDSTTFWKTVMGILKKKLKEYDLNTLLKVLEYATNEDWVIEGGFIVSTVFCDTVIQRTIQNAPHGKPQKKKAPAPNYVTYTNTDEVDLSDCPF